MDDFIEFIVDLVLDIGTELVKSEKTPKWLRTILAAIFILLAAALSIGLLVVGVIHWSESPVLSAILILAGLLLLFFGGRQLYRDYRKKKDSETFL